jgi:hypothetical protein
MSDSELSSSSEPEMDSEVEEIPETNDIDDELSHFSLRD